MIRWLLVAVCFWASTAHAVQVTDDRGVVVDVARAPRRVITLLPSLTEIVCELGACERLVGVDDYSDWPAAVRRLPRVGGLEDTHIEQVVALRPDVVLLASSARAMARLESLGIKVIALEPRSIADLHRVWLQVGQVLGATDAAAKWERLQAKVDATARGLPASLRGTRVYFEVNSAPYAASETSFIGQLLTRLGVANVVPGSLGPFPKLNPEFIVRADPQVIMISDHDANALKGRPGWDRIRAVREGRVCIFDAAQGDTLVRPGPRMAQAVQLMADCLQGRLKARAP